MLRICGLATPLAAAVSDGKYLRTSAFSSNSSNVTVDPMRRLPLESWIPPSSLMFLIFTTRLGVARYSFMRLMRSVPPASTSASPQRAPSMPTASCTVLGFAYSKGCIMHSSFPGRLAPGRRLGEDWELARQWRWPPRCQSPLLMRSRLARPNRSRRAYRIPARY